MDEFLIECRLMSTLGIAVPSLLTRIVSYLASCAISTTFYLYLQWEYLASNASILLAFDAPSLLSSRSS